MKSTTKFLTVTGFAFLITILCSISANAQPLTDINGKIYKTFKIGMQEWMAENLNVDRFRNGDAIPQAKTKTDWEKAGRAHKPAWCYYNNDIVNGKKYGKLYNYYAISDPRGLAPKGWHVPNNKDWKQVIQGTNKSGFKATPGGSRIGNGTFINIDKKGQWWSTSGDVGDGAESWSVLMKSLKAELSYVRMNKETGLSIRCLKD